MNSQVADPRSARTRSPAFRILLSALVALTLGACQASDELDVGAPGSDTDPLAPHDESIGERTFGLVSDTLPQYAAKCDAEIGVTVPDFNCDDGTLVPTTNLANGKCDRPNRLNQECDPGSRFRVLTSSASAYVVAHCRKRGLGAGRYADIAVIQYNRQNGATCFYQALGNLDGHVKAPSKGTGAWPWLTPSGTAGIGCAGCHDNGPLIRSPYLTQITGANKLPGAGDLAFNRDQPYRFVGNDFAAWRVSKVEVQGNTCNGCHRMGWNNVRPSQGTALDLGLRATATGEVAKNPHSAASPIWMTPGATFYNAANDSAAHQIAACAAAARDGAALPAGCRVTDYTGPPSTSANFVDGSVWRGGWCSHAGAQFGKGDFNGDGKTDFFCHDPAGPGSAGNTWVMVSNGSSFIDGSVWLSGWCSHSGSTFGTGDFNGDGRTDVYCKDPIVNGSAGNTWIAVSTGSGFVDGSVWLGGWCSHSGASFGTGDFNGDGKTDIYCKDPIVNGSNGNTWIGISSGAGFTDGSVWLGGWCSHTGATFGTGDFNGDGKTDIYCKDPIQNGSNGNTWIALSTGGGFVDGSVWLGGWCSHNGASFGVGDFNGDRKSDIYCHDPMVNGSNGNTWVALSTGGGFVDGSVWLSGWCSHTGASFGLGDFNGDRHSDLYCHDPIGGASNGNTWVALSAR